MNAATQISLDLFSVSPINTRRMGGQNLRLYEYLKSGGRIHCFHPTMKQLRIGYLNSRVADLKNLHNIPIKSEFITVQDSFGESVDVKVYYL